MADAGPDIKPELGALLRPRGDISASAYVDAERVLLGQTFNLLIVISADGADPLEAELPSALSLGPGFEPGRRHREQRTRVDGSPSLEIQVEVTAWRVGRQAIPPITVVVPESGVLRTVHTSPVRIEVVGLVVDEQATIRDSVTPVAVVHRDTSRLYLPLAGLAALAFSIVGVLLWRTRRTSAGRAVVREIRPGSPAATARQALRDLADSGALEADDRAPAFHAMAEIMRAYLGRRFALASQDTTTEELIAELEWVARQHDAPADLAELVERTIRPWLETCDLVKFAGARASIEDAVSAYKDAIVVVERTAETGVLDPAEEDQVPEILREPKADDA